MSCNDCKKRKHIMKEIISNLTENDIELCTLWDEALKDKRNIQTHIITKCYQLAFNQPLLSNCPDCLRNAASHIHNYYKTILDKWNNYKSQLNTMATTTEQPIVNEVVEKKEVKKTPERTSKSAKKKVKKVDDDDIIKTL